MLTLNSFRTARQLIPVRRIQNSFDLLELDKHSKKIGFINLFKALFYSVVVKNNRFSRSIASVAKRKQGQQFTKLSVVSHVSVRNRLQNYAEDKIDAILLQFYQGLSSGSGKNSGNKALFLDVSTYSLPYSRTSDELPKFRSKGNKGLM